MPITVDQWNAIWTNGYDTGWNDRYRQSHYVPSAPSAQSLDISPSDWNAVWTQGFQAAYGKRVDAPAPGAIANLSTQPVAAAAGGTYGFGELQTLWIQAGGATHMAPLMAAVALAESTGNPMAYNPQPCSTHGDHAEGLWQICMPENSQYVPGGNAYDAAANAKGAVRILASQGLGAWTTYPNPALSILAAHGGQPPSPVSVGPGGVPSPPTQPTQRSDPIALLHAFKALDCAGDDINLWKYLDSGVNSAVTSAYNHHKRLRLFRYVNSKGGWR